MAIHVYANACVLSKKNRLNDIFEANIIYLCLYLKKYDQNYNVESKRN